MTESKEPPTPTSSDRLPDDREERAPISEPRPSSPPADRATLEKDDPIVDDGPVSPDEAGTPPVTREMVDAFLGTGAAQDRIRQVASFRCPKGTPDDVIDDIAQRANLKALRTQWLPRSVPRMRPWLSRLTQNEAIQYLREQQRDHKWLDREVDVQELPPDPASEGDEVASCIDDPTAPPRPLEVIDDEMLGSWLDEQRLTEADKLTLEMVRHKAKSKESNAQVAARFGMGEAAYESRLARFRAKWMPVWKREKERRRRNRMLLWLGIAAAIALTAWIAWRMATGERAAPRRTSVVTPEPSASASPSPSASSTPLPPVPVPVQAPVFNQAAPTQPSEPDAGSVKPPLKP